MDKSDVYFIVGIIVAVAAFFVVTNRRTNKVNIKNNTLRDGDIVGGDKNVHSPTQTTKP